jgi:TrmH family RNA methyltransferase
MTGGARRISSRDNPLYREFTDLSGSARERRRLGRSVLEGIHLCEAYLQQHGAPLSSIVSESGATNPEVVSLLVQHALVPAIVADALFANLSTLAQGVGIAFIVETPNPSLPETIELDAVYLDRLQDPGNVGTLLRTCAAAGVKTVFTAPGTAWCWSPKVLRAAMGAHVALDIIEQMPWRDVADRLDVGVLATSPTAAMPLWQADLRAPAIWVFGSEGAGLDRSLIGAGPVRWLGIPQAPGVESLNVASAVAVCLFEQRRQRGLSAAAAPAGSS